MRFEFTLEEMKQLRSLVHQHSGSSTDGKALTKKFDDYTTQLEEYNEKRKFREPCRFGGFCRDESLYEDCVKDERMKNNWMCWRDGILEKDQGPKPLKSSGEKPEMKRDENGKYPKPEMPEGKCKECGHNWSMHSWLPYLGKWFCDVSSQFVCGCTGEKTHTKSICNVCDSDHGNIYCLNRHLGESPDCREEFVPTYWGQSPGDKTT